MSRKVGYIRVSTTDQNTDRQDLGAMDRVFEEKLSGKSRERPELARMLDFIWTGDEVHVWSIDRLARNLQDLLALVKEITQDKQCKLVFHKENLTFGGEDNIYAELQLNMMGAFAEFERKLTRARQAEGIAKAKERGVYKGRQPTIDRSTIANRVAQGDAITTIARDLNISRQSVYRIMREVSA